MPTIDDEIANIQAILNAKIKERDQPKIDAKNKAVADVTEHMSQIEKHFADLMAIAKEHRLSFNVTVNKGNNRWASDDIITFDGFALSASGAQFDTNSGWSSSSC